MEKLIKIQAELKSPKNQMNKFGGYKYRSCEDILESVKPLLDKHGLVLNVSDSLGELCGIPYIESTATIFDPKKPEFVISSKAQAGIDTNQKGMSIGQCFGSSSSYARKYALNGLLLIDDNKDDDATNKHEVTDGSKDKTKTAKKTKIIAGTAEYNKLVSWIQSGKGTIEKALESYDIDKATENILKNQLNNK